MNFFNSAFYKAFKVNDEIVICGMVFLTFNWENYLTFGIDNISTESFAYFKYVDTGVQIIPTLDQKIKGFSIRADANRLIVFYARIKHS